MLLVWIMIAPSIYCQSIWHGSGTDTTVYCIDSIDVKLITLAITDFKNTLDILDQQEQLIYTMGRVVDMQGDVINNQHLQLSMLLSVNDESAKIIGEQQGIIANLQTDNYIRGKTNKWLIGGLSGLLILSILTR